MLDALNVNRPGHLRGSSLLPSLQSGGPDPAQAEVVFEWHGKRGRLGVSATTASERAEATSQRSIRRGRWKLTVDAAGQHELYNLATDPHETRNLLFDDRLQHSPAGQAALEDLWSRLQAW